MRYNLPVLPQTSFESDRYFTQDEFRTWVRARKRDLERFELLNGRIVMNPPSGWPQGEVGLAVGSMLRSFVKQRDLGRVFGSDQGFELPSGDTVAPDAAYVSAQRWQAGEPHEPGGFPSIVPDLVVEVLSPSTATRDRGEKKAIYERNGVAEYWIVDALGRSILRFDLDESSGENRYALPQRFEEGDRFASSVLAGLDFDVGEILA